MSSSMQSDKKESMPPRTAMTGRRHFLGAGSAVTPVILTLFSQPALGATCFTPSRSLSRNTSVSQQGKYSECWGQSPGNYAAQTVDGMPSYSWPISPDTPFHPTFIAGSVRGANLFLKPVYQEVEKTIDGNKVKVMEAVGEESMTMLEVLNLRGNEDSSKFAFHMIGAYLNCLGGLVSPLAITAAPVNPDVASVTGIWKEWVDTGSYEVMAGVKWGPAEIKTYLFDNGIIK